MRIAICDDEVKQIEIIKNYLADEMISDDYSICEAQSGEELLKLTESEQLDIVFLDIEMKELNGIETGHIIRERNPDAIIVFVTGFKDFALQAFGIKAFDYIIKPLTKRKFKSFIKDARQRLNEIALRQDRDQRILVKTKGVLVELAYNEVVFFEKNRHQVIAHTVDNKEIMFYGSFKELKPKLSEDWFVQCHQGFIVNMEHVEAYKNKTIFFKHEFMELPVSKTYVRTVKNAIENRLFR